MASEPTNISPLPIADGERAALARHDHQIVIAAEDHGDGKRALETPQRVEGGAYRIGARFHLAGDEMGDHFGVGVAGEGGALCDSSSFSSRKFSMMPLCTTETSSVMCGCALASVGLPWVAQRVWPMPVSPSSGARFQARFEIAQFAFGATAAELAVLDGGDAGGIVAAIFKPLQCVDELARDRSFAEDANNAAHQPNSNPASQRLPI